MYSIQVGIVPHTPPGVALMGDVLKRAQRVWHTEERPAKRQRCDDQAGRSAPFGVTLCSPEDIQSTAPGRNIVDTVISCALHSVIHEGGSFLPPHAFSNGEITKGHDISRGVVDWEAFERKYPPFFNADGTWKHDRVVVPIHRRAEHHWMSFVIRPLEKTFEVPPPPPALAVAWRVQCV